MAPEREVAGEVPSKSDKDILQDDYLAMDDQAIEQTAKSGKSDASPMKIQWSVALTFLVFHILAINELYKLFTGYWSIFQFAQMYIFVYFTSMIGIAGGAHRLWAHRSYKARLPLRILLIILNTMSGQMSAYSWAFIHRIHHKFTETDADPHDIRRGFFFAHFGWLLVSKHPEVHRKAKMIDMSDLRADGIVMFQHKYYNYMSVLFTFILPALLFQTLWGTPFWDTLCFVGILRYLISIHFVSLTNSYAHYYGNKPYDRRMAATNPPALGYLSDERWHNYHHVFPWDYKSSEFDSYEQNFIKLVIDFFAWIGWAYDLKTVDKEMVKKRVLRTGDGTHPVWGWGDKDVTEDHIKATVTVNKKK